ncbi:MAG TPA: tetratricopeptide repeat protein [Chitinophagaceae bacterium]|nr:tetratricopeptide repeat protein [Chitinophagaceae bacterium]
MNNDQHLTQEDWEELERYLEGTLTGDAYHRFHNRLSTDPALRAMLEEVRLLRTGIREVKLRGQLDDFHRELAVGAAPVRKIGTNRKWYALAAASFILVLVTVGILFSRTGSQGEKLFAAFFEPDPGLATTMSAESDYAFNRGMIDFKTGQYAAAIDRWRPLLAGRPDSDTLHYFTGVAYLALGQADSTIPHLRTVWGVPQGTFRTDAGWYLALALLRQNRKQEALSYLQQTTHPRKDELLSRLKP